jgi:hypothetical protein
MSEQQLQFKSAAGRWYVHADAFSTLPSEAAAKLATAEGLVRRSRRLEYNVARFETFTGRVALLNYPKFFEDAFPALLESWRVDLSSGQVSYRTYEDSFNPPVLHRKELLLQEGHPRRPEFAALTRAAEAIGLMDHATRIGFREQWLSLVRDKGYQIIGHEFIPIANDDLAETTTTADSDGASISRHLTALVRNNFSAPVQALTRYGLINPSTEVFDYGCGRGDDVRGLTENGIVARGWDPFYARDGERRKADVVNLGFVINVIEDFQERVEALQGAYGLTARVLAVAAMLASQATRPGKPYRDGFLTSRNTFQKYYTQDELAAFISDVVGEEPVPVSPGIFFVFRDKNLEQVFRAGRCRNTTLLRRLTQPKPISIHANRPNAVDLRYETNKQLIDDLWGVCLRLGRWPDITEVENVNAIAETFGSLQKALRLASKVKDQSLLVRAREGRIADLTVYLALAQFAKRQPYKRLEAGLQRDIHSFYGDYSTGESHARQQLFTIGLTGFLYQRHREITA